MRFAHKHVKDNHEKTRNHVCTPVSFLCLDESKLFCVHLDRHHFPTWIENDNHARRNADPKEGYSTKSVG
jgi:hypothetical protein